MSRMVRESSTVRMVFGSSLNRVAPSCDQAMRTEPGGLLGDRRRGPDDGEGRAVGGPGASRGYEYLQAERAQAFDREGVDLHRAATHRSQRLSQRPGLGEVEDAGERDLGGGFVHAGLELLPAVADVLAAATAARRDALLAMGWHGVDLARWRRRQGLADLEALD